MTNNHILMVDDDPATVRVMGRILAGMGPLRFADSGLEALQMARESPPDLILLDAEMPGMSGFDVCRKLKAYPELAEIPVIFITSHAEAEFEVAGFELGAADFIAKPVNPPLMLARVKTQLRFKHMADEMRHVAMVDGLTGVANRRCFDETLSREWQRSRRGAQPMSLLMIDIDHFKQFNDHYGHPAGDTCLRAVAQSLVAAGLRPADRVARFGGEEFAVLLPETARAGAEHMAHRVLDAIEALAIPHQASATALHVTVSVGVACYDDASNGWIEASADSRFLSTQGAHLSAGELLAAADSALYAAKDAGRAQAMLLDIADFDASAMAREIAPAHRPRRAKVRAGAIAP